MCVCVCECVRVCDDKFQTCTTLFLNKTSLLNTTQGMGTEGERAFLGHRNLKSLR